MANTWSLSIIRDFCATWNIPGHITSDGGPQMMSGVFQKWMKDWDTANRPSNTCIHHDRADTAIKFIKAILQYRNTPHQDCKRSPAQMVFEGTLRDHIPCLPYKYAANAD